MANEANTLSIEAQHILEILKQADQGLKISEISAIFPHAIARRTLQRRLAELEKSQLIEMRGVKSSIQYFLKKVQLSLPLSKTAQQLKLYLAQPLTKRKPVAYHPDFLFSYQPNKTFYLSEKIRSHLLSVGQQFRQKVQPGTFAKRILHRLLIDLSWNSSRLEGNTYSLLETERLIAYGAAAAGKNAFETQMIINHKEAIEFMVEQIDTPQITRHVVFNIHAFLSNNLLANPRSRGQVRKIPVGINRTVYHPPEIPQLIEECFQTIIDKANKIRDPIEQGFFLMVQLPYLQPFEDVNKCVSRLAVNIPLMKNNLSPLSFMDVPTKDYIGGLLAVYELNNTKFLRDVFIWAYERSAQNYKLIQDTLTEPNLIVMRYKKILFELVNCVVTQNIQGQKIISTIEQRSIEQVDKPHQKDFALQAEKEIASLHEGNIAIYRISPQVFSRWRRKRGDQYHLK